MTKNKYELKFFTSPWNREQEIRAPYWGASLGLGLLPFQVRLLKAKVGKSTGTLDFIHGVKLERLSKFNTPLSNPDEYDLSITGWGHNIFNCYFFPNPIITEWSNERKVGLKNEQGKTRLAALCFIPIDIDFDYKRGFGFNESMKLIEKLPIKPDVIVYTGNGVQIYWSIQHHYVLPRYGTPICSDYELQLKGALNLENRAKLLLKAITPLVGGDIGPSHNPKGIMRIPETYNFKIKKERARVVKGEYISGDIVNAYHNPVYTLQELLNCYCPESVKKCNGATVFESEYQYQKEKRPKVYLENIDEAFKKLCSNLGISKPRKNFYKFFKIPYGHRFLYRYMEHRESNQKSSGLSRRDLIKERKFFLQNGLIERLSEHKHSERISAFYRPTQKFYEYIGEAQPHKISDIKQIISDVYPTGRFNTLVLQDIKKLNRFQLSKYQKREIIIEKIKRSPDLRHVEDRIQRANLLLQ